MINFESVPNFRVITDTVINFKLVDENAKLPVQVEPGSSGFDLYSVEEVTIEPGEFKLISTGLIWEPFTNEIEMQIRPRSGLAAKHGITVLNSPGSVDASYRGIIKVILINHSKEPYTIKIGERMAQAVFARVIKGIHLQEVDVINESTRPGGFGDSGKNEIKYGNTD